ncbi:S9 family peptidase [Mucilaginibacter arboris]|uniref:Prolyl oligopeptidase family serine peptidase n=1 Tax=Mucilaginibacter arboris TaxID=2682090 RepID=A0A7K1SUW6_9SPHI|nr:prolyl oligopeptidase family serine peptidase [Mucilaginibacter arboris]MVN21132.1 prolyl oligopeptidase family serine peptidase [Mucilaginibacter arboris]
MRRRYYLLTLCLVAVVFNACINHVRKIPVISFFKTPEKSAFHISPNGKYISYLKLYKDKLNIYVQSVADGKESQVTSFADYPVKDYFWTLNNELVFNKDLIDLNQYQLFAMNMQDRKLKKLLSLAKVRLRLISRSNNNKDWINIAMNKRDSATFDVYKLNTQTGELKLYIKNPGNITEWYPASNGNIRLAKASDGVNETILFRQDDNHPFKPIISNNFRNSVTPIAFIKNQGNHFYALSNLNRDKTALVEIDAETGKEVKMIYDRKTADIGEVNYSRNKHRLDIVNWEGAKPERHFMNQDIKLIYENLSKLLPDNEIKIIDRDTSENKLLISTYTDRSPGSVYLYEADAKRLTKLTDFNPDIKPEEMCAMKPVTYKASDGLLINGYLTLPQTSKQTDLPVIMMPHGGPWSRNSWGYNAEVQFLANRGYAVFQVNYRGSTGYGKAFMSAGFKEVGGKMQQDITDGVKWLIENKIANPKQIGIYGGGFGGFSALHGVSFNPGLYQCAVVQYGLINFFTFIKDVPPFLKPYLSMTYEMVGNPDKDADMLRAISPVFHTDKIKVPLLIFQGAKDPRANISELNQFVRDLRSRDVPVKYVLKENERTYFKNENNRLAMYAEIESFLENNLKNKK